TGRSSPVPGSISSSWSEPRRRSSSFPTVTFGDGIAPPRQRKSLDSFRDYFLKVRQRLLCGAFPGKCFCEPATGVPQDVDEVPRLDDPAHSCRHGFHVALRHEKPGFAV